MSSHSIATSRTRDQDDTRSPWVVRLVATMPLHGALFLAVLGSVSTLFALYGAFRGQVVLPIAVVVTLVLLPAIGLGQRRVSRSALVVDLLALVLAAGFAVANAKVAGQDIVVGRDPGTYSVTARWLVDHPSLDINTHLERFGQGGNGLGFASAGFGVLDHGHLYAQGAHVVPEILAVSGTFLGDSLMFKTDPLIGALALLSFFAFARLVVGRWLALTATALVAVSLPMLAFTRDNYTEPFSMLLVFGGLAMLWRAQRGQSLLWGVSGFVLAGSCLARIDAFLTLPPLLLYAALTLAVAPKGRARLLAARDVAALVVGAAVPAVLGVRDLQKLSFGYYRDLHSEFRQIEELVVAALVVSVVVVVAAWATPAVDLLERHSDAWRSRLASAAFGVLVLAGLALAARPLFETDRSGTNPGQVMFIASLQKNAHQAVDGTRLYSENSVTWQAWYIGPVVVALSLFGIGLLVRRVIVKRELRLVPFLLFLLITAGLYLYKPSITPDQIWAMRRYLPVVIPGAALGAAYVVLLVLRRLPRVAAVPVVLVLLAATFGPVLYISRPLLRVQEGGGQLNEVHRVCDAVPANGAVVIEGELSIFYAQTLRSFCGVDVVTQSQFDPARLAAAQATLATAGKQLYLVGRGDLTGDTRLATPAAGAPQVFSTITVQVWNKALTKPPRNVGPSSRTLYVGRVGSAGTVEQWLHPTS